MLFICYARCSTCQKARKWLDEKGITYTFRDIKTHNPSYEELMQWYRISHLPLKRFFNTSGAAYRSLNLKDRLSSMDEQQSLELLATDGMLVKRPLLIGHDFVLAGFREQEWTETLEK
jgi:arsenate reductase